VLTGLTLPPRLVLRALDDLHALAEAARTLPEVERRLTARVEALEVTGRELLVLGERVEVSVQAAVAAAAALDAHGADLLGAAERLDQRLGSVVEALPTIEAFEASAKALAQAVVPLQGVADRLGRVVDRLPGARRPT
jgi:hypothetical protein